MCEHRKKADRPGRAIHMLFWISFVPTPTCEYAYLCAVLYGGHNDDNKILPPAEHTHTHTRGNRVIQQ